MFFEWDHKRTVLEKAINWMKIFSHAIVTMKLSVDQLSINYIK